MIPTPKDFRPSSMIPTPKDFRPSSMIPTPKDFRPKFLLCFNKKKYVKIQYDVEKFILDIILPLTTKLCKYCVCKLDLVHVDIADILITLQ